MDLIASFSSQKVERFNFFILRGLMGDSGLFFLFDTGAICPVIGVNSFFVRNDNPDYSSNVAALTKILQDEIKTQKILARPKPLKTANNQSVTTYPCVCHKVSISNTPERDFYFDISLDEINIPLLGSSFIDDCAYSHAINGNIIITGIKEQAGAEYYKGLNILEFDDIAIKFQKDRIS